MHSGTEADGHGRHDPSPAPRRRVVAGGAGRGGGAPPPDPLTDTAPAGGLHKFDLGMVPASVTPPRTWRHAAWFVITTSAAALGGVVLAGSLLVNSPVRLDGLDLPSIPRGDYPPVQPSPGPQPQPQRTTPPQPQHPLSAPPVTTAVGTRPLAGPSAAVPARETTHDPAPRPSEPPAQPEPPAPPADGPAEQAPPPEIELPEFDDFPAEPPPLPTFPPDDSPPLFSAPPPVLSSDEQHQALFSGELPTAPAARPSTSAAECAAPTGEAGGSAGSWLEPGAVHEECAED